MNQLQNGGSLNLPYIEAFKLLKFRDWNVENRQNVILNNVDYPCKGIKTEVLRGKISEVVLSVTKMQIQLQSAHAYLSWWFKMLKIGQKCQFQPNLA